MSISRGTLVLAKGRRMLVLSGGMFNSIPGEPGVIAINVVKGPPGLLNVPLSGGWVALPGHIYRIPKAVITETYGDVGVQKLTEINNMLFRILATD